MKKKRLYYIVLLVLPVVMVITALFLNHARGPFWLGSNLDPEYVYLLNAANLAGMRGVGHIDHPGTPVQMIGAITIRVVHFFNFSSGVDWHTDVLQRPEYYLNAINIVMISLNTLMLLILGIAAFILTRNIWLGLWLQGATFFSVTLLQFGLTRVTPEPLLFFSSSALVTLMVALAYRYENVEKGNGRFKKPAFIIILFALITGFGIANKITFIPMMVIPLLALPKLKNKIYYLAGVGIGFVIFTLPIIRMYPRFFDWIYNLLSHSGRYGSGPSKLIASQQYFHNIKKLLVGNPFFSISLILAVVIVIAILLIPRWRKVFFSTLHFKLLSAAAAAQLLGLLMVSKHSANHYLLPVLNLAGIVFFLIFFHVKTLVLGNKINSKIIFIAVIIFIGFLFILLNPPAQLRKEISHLENLQKKALVLHQEVQKNYKDYAKIYYYRSSSLEYGLKFGNDLSRSYHWEILEKLYKDVYFYDIWTKRFTGFDYNRAVPFAEIRAKYGNKIVFQGSRAVKIPGLELKEVSGSRFYEGIFMLNDL